MREMRVVAVGLLLLCVACASNRPNRSAMSREADEALAHRCQALYDATDARIKQVAGDFTLGYRERTTQVQAVEKQIDAAPRDQQECWTTSHERHSDFDLFYAEFDDGGQATDMALGRDFEDSEIHAIEASLLGRLHTGGNSGVNLVVFAHGWHGNSRADNDYSVEFKGLLEDVVAREKAYAQSLPPTTAADRGEPHRVIGIEISWRGDSFLNPGIPFVSGSQNALSAWDRKLAAETVSMGAVHQLFAFLNQLYLDNSCQGAAVAPTSGGRCDRVHLLTLGHSFGALIDWRSLISRVDSGLNVDRCTRTVGLGDLTVLLNPAFEGERYRAVFNDAKDRHLLKGPYLGDQSSDSKCPDPPPGLDVTQHPVVVTLQSLGDSATGTFFPIFRRLGTWFDNSRTTEEAYENRHAIGWVPAFRTHTLALTPAGTEASAMSAVTSEAPVAQTCGQSATAVPAATHDACPPDDGTSSYCPFKTPKRTTIQGEIPDANRGAHPQYMRLCWTPGTANLPNYMPLWSVGVQTQIMENHDDYWNPQVVRLISILFQDAYEQSERLHSGR